MEVLNAVPRRENPSVVADGDGFDLRDPVRPNEFSVLDPEAV